MTRLRLRALTSLRHLLLTVSIGASVSAALSGCTQDLTPPALPADATDAQGDATTPEDAWDWGLPDGYPAPVVPPDNPMSAEKVLLGRHLFYDQRLSINQTMACATCHLQALAFTDGKAQAVGATGQVHPRNAMALVNVAYSARLTWANHLIGRLEDQAMLPLFGEVPIVEHGLAGREAEVLATLRADATYGALFPAAFPQEADPFTVGSLVRALAAFQRTLLSFGSPYDRYIAGDEAALSDAAKRGMALFFSERLECFHCHGGFNFSDSLAHDSRPEPELPFHNTGLYNIDGAGSYPSQNTGLYELTGRASDMGRFRAPTLRNVALTAPYMHDGSAPTLDAVLDHYAAGGRTITEGPYAGIGAESPLKSQFVKGFTLTPGQRADLIAFLESLTDEGFITDPRHASPWPAQP